MPRRESSDPESTDERETTYRRLPTQDDGWTIHFDSPSPVSFEPPLSNEVPTDPLGCSCGPWTHVNAVTQPTHRTGIGQRGYRWCENCANMLINSSTAPAESYFGWELRRIADDDPRPVETFDPSMRITFEPPAYTPETPDRIRTATDALRRTSRPTARRVAGRSVRTFEESSPMPSRTDAQRAALNVNNMSFEFFDWQTPGFDRVATSMYPFFSRHSNRRYSETSMRNLQQVPEQYNRYKDTAADRLHTLMPILCVASIPFSYDEETEVKVGGTTGMLVCFPNQNFKCMLAVHGSGRRLRIASTLWEQMSYRIPRAEFWVHRSNAEGQHWLLTHRFFATAMSASGAIRFTQFEEEE